MKARRKRSDPQATRYRVAVTALAKAEKRYAAAEKAIAELRRKVRSYERRISPERRAEIEAGTVVAKAVNKARADVWKQAERTLRAAAMMAGVSAKEAAAIAINFCARLSRPGITSATGLPSECPKGKPSYGTTGADT